MTKNQRLVLFIAIFASFLSFLDGSVVNVALPAITDELGGGLSTQQWVTNSYLITLGSLILVAGSLSDLFGYKRILLWGVIGFGIASVLCALAPTAISLISARALQGAFGALLVPSSLALIIANFEGKSEGRAIGSWTAWTGMAFIVGPLIGGILVDSFSWRWVFLINVIPTLITLWLMRRLQSDKIHNRSEVDWVGSLLCTIGLAGTVLALIEQPRFGWDHPLIILSLSGGILSLFYFVLWEKRTKYPMLPLSLFAVRNFSVGNLATMCIYAGLAVATFLIIIFVQQVGHYSALAAGLTVLPVTIIMFFLSSRFGALADKYGPRLFMGLGPIIAAAGFIIMLRVDSTVNYWTQLLPGILLFGLGLSATVAPLTSAILSSIDKRRAGIGSAVNNAVARIAGLIAVAAIGVVVGSDLTLEGFHRGLITIAILMFVGGVISTVGIQNPTKG